MSAFNETRKEDTHAVHIKKMSPALADMSNATHLQPVAYFKDIFVIWALLVNPSKIANDTFHKFQFFGGCITDILNSLITQISYFIQTENNFESY